MLLGPPIVRSTAGVISCRKLRSKPQIVDATTSGSIQLPADTSSHHRRTYLSEGTVSSTTAYKSWVLTPLSLSPAFQKTSTLLPPLARRLTRARLPLSFPSGLGVHKSRVATLWVCFNTMSLPRALHC